MDETGDNTGGHNMDMEGFAMSEIAKLLSLSKVGTRSSRESLDSSLRDLLGAESAKDKNKKFQAANIVYSLLQKANLDVREMLVERLRLEDDAPVQLMMALAYDHEMSVAVPIIEHHDFQDDELEKIIENGAEGHWQAISKKDNLSSMIVSRLLSTKDEGTAMGISHNQSLNLQKKHIDLLKRMAFRAEPLHQAMLNRSEIDMKIASELYWSASQELRSHIIQRFDIDKKTVDSVLEDVVTELVNASMGHHDVTDDLIVMARRYAERREITAQFLTKTLRRGQIAFFTALIAVYATIDIDLAKAIIAKQSGEALAVICKAKSIMKSDYASFFLMTRPASEGQGDAQSKVGHNALAEALSAYDRIKTDNAMTLLDMWRKDPGALEILD